MNTSILLTKNNKIIFSVYIFSILLLSITVFFDTWMSLIAIWMRSDTYAHGFFVLPASLWLIWQNKSLHSQILPTAPSLLGASFILLNGLFWLFSAITKTLVIQQLAVVGMLIGSYWFYLGNSTSKKLIFPLFFLYFMVPVGEEQLLPHLMNYTANFTVALLRLTGISVYREGLHFTLVSGQWSVVEACSGIRYLIASITLGTIYAYITYSKPYKRILFILFSIIAPIIANGLRAYMIVMIGHLSNMKLATGVDHIVYGAFFFAIIIFIMFYIGSFWRDSEVKTENISNKAINRNTYSKKQNSIIIACLLLSQITWPLSSQQLQSRYHAQTSIPEWSALIHNTQWQEVKAPNWNWQPQFKGVSTDSLRYFKNKESIIGLYQANFGDETQGSELINMQNTLINSDDRKNWRFIKQSTQVLSNPKNKESIALDTAELYGNSTNHLFTAKWYQIGGFNTNNPYLAKIYQLYKRLILNMEPEIYCIVFTTQPKPLDTATPAIQSFITQFILNDKVF